MKKYMVIVLIFFTLSSFAQRTDLNFYLSLKKMDLGQLEERLTFDDWNYQKIRKNTDYMLALTKNDRDIKLITFEFFNDYTGEYDTSITIYKFSIKGEESLIRFETSDFDFYQSLLKNIIGKGYSIKESQNVGTVLSEDFHKYGDEVLKDKFEKIYSNDRSEIKITLANKVKLIRFTGDDKFIYEDISRYFSFEF